MGGTLSKVIIKMIFPDCLGSKKGTIIIIIIIIIEKSAKTIHFMNRRTEVQKYSTKILDIQFKGNYRFT